MNLAVADRRKLVPLLDELARGVEELLLSGLTTASESTRRMLEVSFQEAARMRLLRLGSTLRMANEELGKFVRHDEGFSRARLGFFLTRAWLLAKGLARALNKGDEKEFDNLLRIPSGQPVAQVEVVTLGVSRKWVPGSFCAFDFRLRCLTPVGPIPEGGRLVWSCVFPLSGGQDIPAEAFLHLPQKQGFKTQIFLDRRRLLCERVSITPDEGSGGRLTLGPESTVTTKEPFNDWQRFANWDLERAIARVRAHQAGPLELDIELQEEVVLANWEVGSPVEEEDGQMVYPIATGTTTFHAPVPPGPDGKPIRQALDARRGKKGAAPLYGLMHYERCRLTVLPLSILGASGPELLTLSTEKVNLAALLKTIKF
jgi:hypothetical protein